MKRKLNLQEYYTIKEASSFIGCPLDWLYERCKKYDSNEERPINEAVPFVLRRKHRMQKQKLILGKTIKKIMQEFK